MKSKQGAEVSRKQYVHHKNTTATLLQTFGVENHFVPRNLEVDSESNHYTNIQSEYVGNMTKTKFLEARVLAYDMTAPFIVPVFLN